MNLKSEAKVLFQHLTGMYLYQTLPHGVDLYHDIKASLPDLRIDVIFDVGANDGESARHFARQFPTALIYSFEPVESTYDQLAHDLRHHTNVQTFKLALGPAQGSGKMVVGGDSKLSRLQPSGQRAVMPDDARVEDVDLQTIDGFCDSRGITHINILKIDTEGHDLEVLHGAERMLRERRIDVIQVEAGMNRQNRLHVAFGAFMAFLEPRGYSLLGLYEQMNEWATGEPNLRRTNPVFVSEPVKLANTASRVLQHQTVARQASAAPPPDTQRSASAYALSREIFWQKRWLDQCRAVGDEANAETCRLDIERLTSERRRLVAPKPLNWTDISRSGAMFWTTRIIAATLGETAANQLSSCVHIGLATSTIVLAALLFGLLASQIAYPRRHHLQSWGVILLAAMTGTALSDLLCLVPGLDPFGRSLLLGGLAVVFLGMWHWLPRRIAAPDTGRVRLWAFYCATLPLISMCGTTLGDDVASSFGFGTAALLAACAAGIVALLPLLFTLSPIRLFWLAFVLTQAIGATLGDFLARPMAEGGLQLGTPGASVLLAAMFLTLILLGRPPASNGRRPPSAGASGDRDARDARSDKWFGGLQGQAMIAQP